MAGPHKNFPPNVQQKALERQGGKCGSCGTNISGLGKTGIAQHKFGEGVEAHHVIPHGGLNGDLSLENCVILCKSCHYSAHMGGQFKATNQYSDLKSLPLQVKISLISKEYPHYWGPGRPKRL